MVEVKEVVNKKMQKEFLNFPLDLYKDVEQFVPPLYGDEKKIFDKNYMYYDTCEAIHYNAYKDGKIVGRIQGIIQNQSNEIRNEKRVRFSRFDSIDDQEVANALFDAVKNWAIEKGMDTICGPLGFSDLEREGLLIWGFEEISTFEEQYTYEYYPKLIENYGFKKEIDWVEYKIYPAKEIDPKIQKISEIVKKRYDLHIVEEKSVNKLIKKYKDGIFDCLNESYKDLYGVVPYTEKMKNELIKQFKTILNVDFIVLVCDKNEKVVGFGLAFPSLSKAMRKCDGKLLPFGFIHLLKALKKPTIFDFGLIAVLPEYQSKGVNGIILQQVMEKMIELKLDYCETNLNLESNEKVQAQWKFFEHEYHKRRRSYMLKINDDNNVEAEKEEEN
ncbi:MAG: GNAT family N-acetyltransferase [Clostridia bacterium]|nr:GNAT family N-acetyltransferase [Clostridia bacterium]